MAASLVAAAGLQAEDLRVVRVVTTSTAATPVAKAFPTAGLLGPRANSEPLFHSSSELLTLLRGTACQGASAMVAYDERTHSLVVSAPGDVMAKVEQAMATLHGMQAKRDRSFKIESCLFTAPEGFGKSMGLSGKTEVLTVREAKMLAQAMKADGSGEVLSHPSMVCTDGQKGTFCVGNSELGWSKFEGGPGGDGFIGYGSQFVGFNQELTASASADGKQISVKVKATNNTKGGDGVCNSQFAESTCTVPNGGTFVMPLGVTKCTTKCETAVPILHEVPYVGRLFKNTGLSEVKRETYLIVTATPVTEAAAVAPPCATMAVAGCPLVASRCELPMPVVHEAIYARPTFMALPPPHMLVTGLDQATLPPPMMPTQPPYGVVTPPIMPTQPTAFATAAVPTLPKAVDTRGLRFEIRLSASTGANEHVADYKKACVEGRKDDAMKAALKALAADPTCFGK